MGWGRLPAAESRRLVLRAGVAGAAGAAEASARASPIDANALRRDCEDAPDLPPAAPVEAACEPRDLAVRDDALWVRLPVGAPLAVCVLAGEDGVD